MAKSSKHILPWLLSFITAILLMSGVFAVEASAAVSGDYEYTVTDGKAEITDYTGTATKITIPSKLGGYPVTSIGDYAFHGCRSLTSITIPDSVTCIGIGAFEYCTSLKSITIPDSVTTIGDLTFFKCESLKSVTIPDSVTSIGDDAFGRCTSLTSITIPDSVTTIGECVFFLCESLKSITIPDSVTSIGDGAFFDCTSLTSIDASSSNEHFSSSDGVLFDKNKKTLIAYPAGKKETTYIFPDSVTSIGNSAFCGCTSLTSITIPDSVTSIGNNAFEYCESLESVTIGNSVTTIGYSAFYECKSLKSITIPDSVTFIGNYAFGACTSLKDVYYAGSPSDWKSIKIDDYGNEELLNATIHYNYVPALPKPTILGIKPGDNKVKLEWKAVEGAEMYRVYTYENGAYTRKFTCLGTRNVATVTSLVSGVKLGFVVSAKVNGTWTDYTDKADLVYATPTGDPAPVITGAKGGDGKVKISWYALSGAEMYRVYTCENGAYTRKFTCNGSTNVATVTGLTNGKEYGFVVSAKVNGVWTNYKVSELLVYATPAA